MCYNFFRYQNGYPKCKNHYFYGIFISCNKNRSGSTSVVVISNSTEYNLSGIDLSADKALDITNRIITLKIKLTLQNKSIYHTLLLTKQHNQLKLHYNEKYWQYF